MNLCQCSFKQNKLKYEKALNGFIYIYLFWVILYVDIEKYRRYILRKFGDISSPKLAVGGDSRQHLRHHYPAQTLFFNCFLESDDWPAS